VLVALGARVETTARTLAAEDFFGAGPRSSTVLAPGELVIAITIPPPAPGSVQAYLKFRLRNAIDFPILGVAVNLAVERGRVAAARVVFGAAAPRPWRAREVEAFLVGRALDEETAAGAAEIAVRAVQPLGRNGFKVALLRTLLRRALLGRS
jgi:CO/xanthine dehydrogenase FAD-binding subunit